MAAPVVASNGRVRATAHQQGAGGEAEPRRLIFWGGVKGDSQNGKLSLFERDSASAPYEHCGKSSMAASVANAAEVAESCAPTMACAPASRSL
eukprot:189975-Pleurochrysis_carterae.AAC.3